MKRGIAVVILSILLLLSCSTAFASDAEQTPSGIPFSEIESFIDDYLTQYIGKTSPGAAVVLVKDGNIIFSKGYGYADIDNENYVNSKDTVFEYGSVSKLFVYTTIMQLWEKEKIDLQADIRDYLPEGFLKKLKYDEPITILNIMNHTTGFEDYLFDVVLTSSKNYPTLEQTLRDCQPMQVYRPGTISAYSNYSVALAAYIAEQIIGQDFYEYLMKTMFDPLDMNKTSAHPRLEDKPELTDTKASGYYPKNDGGFKSGGWSYVPLYPVGGINGTAEDLARFAIALMPEDGQNSPLFDKRETLDEMLTQSHSMGSNLTGFAHGFIEWDGEYRGVGHGGNTAAFSSQFNIVPEERFGVIILTNAANEMDISSGLTEALIGKRDKNVTAGTGNLPGANDVEGMYIAARRMHSGFLEVYNYLSLLSVKALEQNKIQLSMMGQTSTLVQTSPYVYQRIDADGAIFKYHFDTVYFEVSNGKVQRMSGDYLPLSIGRTMPWLIVYLLIVIVSGVYFIFTPVVLLIRRLWRKRKAFDEPLRSKRAGKVVTLLVLCGTAAFINNAILIARMLINNYRSFSEVRIHILLNYPLIALSAILAVLFAVNCRGVKFSKGQKFFYLSTFFILFAFIGVLMSWKFLAVVA